uniref:Uncharacterized protein n=1 Tax=Aegilops tauschii subsp. strangulata TaxID=200361 RepID=A0A453NCS3_AEGTS
MRSLILIDCSCSFRSRMASSHHILAKLHLCWVQQDEDQENPDEKHHADSDVEIDDAKPLEESERCSFHLVPWSFKCLFIAIPCVLMPAIFCGRRSNTQSARVKQYWIDHISGITWIYFALPTFVR